MVKIFIDPGHGGKDPGATANGLKEKDVCLKIALRIQRILNNKYSGHRIKLSRTNDQTLSLRERTDMANRWGADYLLSLHINAGGGTGFESYIYNGSSTNKVQAKAFQTIIHDAIIQTTRFKNRGKKAANFHMLRESSMPAILTENGFIDMIKDANKLKNMDFLDEIAGAHVLGLAHVFSLAGHIDHVTRTNQSPVTHVVKRGDTLWSLAKHYHTTVEKLMAWNRSIIPELLQIGEQLIVPKDDHTDMYHTIQKGDTMWQLGIKYGTTVVKLKTLNPGIDPKRLQIEQQIRVR